MFRGRFVVGDEHFPDFIAIPRKGNYISIPSNELIHEYYGSKNGTGGVRYFDASSNPERIYIRGYAITGDLVCGGRSISAQGMSGIFLLIDYGQKVKNSKLEKGEK